VESQLANSQLPGYTSDDDEGEEVQQTKKKDTKLSKGTDPVIHSVDVEKKTGKLTVKLQ